MTPFPPPSHAAEHAAPRELPGETPRGCLAEISHAYTDLAKVRLNAMVVVSTCVGFLIASIHAQTGIDWGKLAWTCLGTFLAAAGASAFNQLIEVNRDARMDRTRTRPLPAGTLSRQHALVFGVACSSAGVAILCPTANGLTALLALANILIYVAIYTPLKTVSSTNTLVGAVVGGIPPMMGWAAATGRLDIGAYLLGALLFVWQIPHFLALAWMYRADYARGGYRMLPQVDPTGRLTALFAILYALALLPIGLALDLAGVTGWLSVVGAIGLGYWLFLRAVIFAKDRSHAAARKLFLCSVMYLPLVLMLLVLDTRHGPQHAMVQGEAGYYRPDPALDQPLPNPHLLPSASNRR